MEAFSVSARQVPRAGSYRVSWTGVTEEAASARMLLSCLFLWLPCSGVLLCRSCVLRGRAGAVRDGMKHELIWEAPTAWQSVQSNGIWEPDKHGHLEDLHCSRKRYSINNTFITNDNSTMWFEYASSEGLLWMAWLSTVHYCCLWYERHVCVLHQWYVFQPWSLGGVSCKYF